MLRFVEYLRTRPLGTRHAILWGGSLLIVILVFGLWVAQIKGKLASTFDFQGGFGGLASVETPALAQEQLQDLESPSFLAQRFSELAGLVKKGGATLIHLVLPGSPTQDTFGEGQELDQFLEHQGDFYQGFPRR